MNDPIKGGLNDPKNPKEINKTEIRQTELTGDTAASDGLNEAGKPAPPEPELSQTPKTGASKEETVETFTYKRGTFFGWHKVITDCFPFFEKRVKEIIAQKSRDEVEIEKLLDRILWHLKHGMSKSVCWELVDYYKNVNGKRAVFYWNQCAKSEVLKKNLVVTRRRTNKPNRRKDQP